MECSEIEIAWMAGLFEGEAYFGVDRRSKTRYKVSTSPASPFLKLAMVDEDVVNRVATIVGKSSYIPSRKTVKNKSVYVVHIGDRATLAYLYPRLLPYMGKRRQEAIQNGIDLLNEWQMWYDEGGRNKMAKEGYKVMREKLMISKSTDMISPDVEKQIRETDEQ